MILLHLLAISIWGAFYVWQGCLPDLETAFYFSGVTYATIGYGDVVLAKPWRQFGLMEGLTGILMCGLSTGLFFAMVNHIYQQAHTRTRDDLKD
jgi:Ion channel.